MGIMKFFRYRKPSVKTLLGLTRAKKALGVNKAMKPVRAPKNFERRVKRKLGYYSAPARIARHGLPRTGGCAFPVVVLVLACAATLSFFL